MHISKYIKCLLTQTMRIPKYTKCLVEHNMHNMSTHIECSLPKTIRISKRVCIHIYIYIYMYCKGLAASAADPEWCCAFLKGSETTNKTLGPFRYFGVPESRLWGRCGWHFATFGHALQLRGRALDPFGSFWSLGSDFDAVPVEIVSHFGVPFGSPKVRSRTKACQNSIQEAV